MKRVPLNRDTEKSRAWLNKPRQRLRQRSARTIREQPIREAVREETILAAGGLCQARHLLPMLPGTSCATWMHDEHGNPTGQVHEVIRRGRRPGVHLDPTLTVYLCWWHHRVITDDEALGRSVGLCWRSHEVEEARAAVAALREGEAH